MHVEIGKITSKGQTTIPTSLRKAFDLSKGDEITFTAEADGIIIRKSVQLDDAYHRSVESCFADEWNSDADQEAFDGL